MSFALQSFEVKSSEDSAGYVFCENISEGRKLCFLGTFPKSDVSSAHRAEEIFGTILDHLKSSTLKSGYDKFEEALKAANNRAREWYKDPTNLPNSVVAFFDFNELYLSQSGEAESYLLRDQNLSQISEASEFNEDLYLNILSGEISLKDTILFTSGRLLRSLTSNQILQFFVRDNFTEGCEQLKEALEQSPEQEYLIVSCMGVGQKEESPSKNFFSKARMKSLIPKIHIPSLNTHSPSQAVSPETELSQESSETKETIVSENSKVDFVLPEKKSRSFKLPKISFSFQNPSFRKTIPLAGVIFATFIVIIGIRAILNYESAEEKELRTSIEIARESLSQADTFLLQGERGLAQEQLVKAEASLTKVAKSKSKLFRSDVGFLLAEIESKKLQAENAKKVSPTLVTDLSVKNDNLEATHLLDLRGNLYVADNNKVYKTIRNVVEKGTPLSDKETIIAAGARPDQNTLIFLSETPKVIEYREGVISTLNTEDETWKQAIDIETYGRYAYFLDPVENQIWKYERRRTNYSSAEAYNSNGADLSRAVSMGIDGAIYVLGDDGSIKKLFRGKPVDYDFKEMPSTPISGKNLRLYTTAELEFIYVLDPDNSRILVFTKGDRFATYKKQVLFDLRDVRDFNVDESGQKVNVLTKDKIYSLPL